MVELSGEAPECFEIVILGGTVKIKRVRKTFLIIDCVYWSCSFSFFFFFWPLRTRCSALCRAVAAAAAVMLAGCRLSQPPMPKDKGTSGGGGGEWGAGCFESCLCVESRWESSGFPIWKRQGWVPLFQHALSIFSFIQTQTAAPFLFLSLFVTLF